MKIENINICLNCSKKTTNPKFCSKKCSNNGKHNPMYNKKQSIKQKIGAIKRMIENNPMKKLGIAKKVSNTLIRKYKNGELIPPMTGKKNLGASKNMKENNPMKNPEIVKKTFETRRQKDNLKWTEIQRKKILSNKNFQKIFFKKGKDNINWQDGKSTELYGIEFNDKLKEIIRKRDNYRCQQCFRHQDELFTKTRRKYKLNIHHIDYNKQNNNFDNIVSLCRNCHMQTNFKRNDWTEYFQNRIGEKCQLH